MHVIQSVIYDGADIDLFPGVFHAPGRHGRCFSKSPGFRTCALGDWHRLFFEPSQIAIHLERMR
jgi:hypothetical protein